MNNTNHSLSTKLTPGELSNRKHLLFLWLSGIFLTNAILAEIVGVKIFSLEKILGISVPFARWGSWHIELSFTAGVLLWPIVFIVSDIINEYFGPTGVRRISWLAAGLISYVFLAIFLVTQLPPADFWLANNNTDNAARFFDIEFAFNKLFSTGLGIIIGSLSAFLIGQFIDAYLFVYIRSLTGEKLLWLRATGSTAISQLFDSYFILTIAFYWLGNWTWGQVLQIGTIQYLYKMLLAVLLTPLIYIAHLIIDNYLGLNTKS
jgi:uncharacterized integral membrane protein (TIGR00697 family)